MRHRVHLLIALALTLAVPAHAAEPVKIGVIYPLTGNAASAGSSAKDAVELGAEIANGTYPELKGSPLAGAAGLAELRHRSAASSVVACCAAASWGTPAGPEREVSVRYGHCVESLPAGH